MSRKFAVFDCNCFGSLDFPVWWSVYACVQWTDELSWQSVLNGACVIIEDAKVPINPLKVKILFSCWL